MDASFAVSATRAEEPREDVLKAGHNISPVERVCLGQNLRFYVRLINCDSALLWINDPYYFTPASKYCYIFPLLGKVCRSD